MTRVQSLAGEFARRGFDSPSAAVTLWSRWLESDASELPISPDSFLVAADRDQALEIICELGIGTYLNCGRWPKSRRG